MCLLNLLRAAPTTLTVGRLGLEQHPAKQQQHQRRSGSLESSKVRFNFLSAKRLREYSDPSSSRIVSWNLQPGDSSNLVMSNFAHRGPLHSGLPPQGPISDCHSVLIVSRRLAFK